MDDEERVADRIHGNGREFADTSTSSKLLGQVIRTSDDVPSTHTKNIDS